MRHINSIMGLAFSPDGTQLASRGDETLRLWDVSTGKEIRQWRDGSCSYPSIRKTLFAPDGKSLFTSDGTLTRWDLATGKKLEGIPNEPGNTADDLAFSPDGKLLASVKCSKGLGVIVLADARTGRHLRRLNVKPAWSLTFSPDGSKLLLNRNRLLELSSGKVLFEVSPTDDHITSAGFSPDGKTLVTGHSDIDRHRFGEPIRSQPSVRLWDLTTGKQIRQVQEDLRCVSQVAYSPDGRTLAVADEAVVKIWDAASGKEVVRLLGCYFQVERFAFSPDGELLAAADEWHRILIWKLPSGKLLHPFQDEEGYINTVAYSPDSKTIATAGDAVIRLRETSTGKRLGELRGHRFKVLSLAYSPDGKRLVSGGTARDGTTRVWDVATRKELQQFRDNGGQVALSADGKYLASGRDPIRVRESASGKEIARVKYWDVYHLCFWPGRNRLAVGYEVPGAEVFEIPGGQALTPFGTFNSFSNYSRIIALTCSPDGNTLASVQPGLGVFFLHIDPVTGKRSRFRWDETDGATAAAYSPDGKTLALGWKSGGVSLWDPATGRERVRLPIQEGPVKALAFAPDGQTLTAVYSDGSALVWSTR